MPNDELRRPNPDDLLEGIKRLDDKSKRGQLRVFFGMCPGVGKTFAMLKAAHEKKKENIDVVIGVVETHGRSETAALTSDIEVIPKRKIKYKSTFLEEMDIDAILARKPGLVLVDELAHTNAPDCRHYKRYQDVQELLLAGINVYTTLNVQHIESRADLVLQITGVPVKEKVPDSFLELADQIELVDISPDVLLARLSEGKVYLGDRAEYAAENFFKVENIIALRELALRFTAEKVDEQLRSQMIVKQVQGVWNTNERIMVAVSQSAFSARLIRSARRMAYSLEAPWVALYVDTGEELTEKEQTRLRKNLNLAKELGAEIVVTRDKSLIEAIKRVALEKNVNQIVIGRPDKRFIRDFVLQGNVLDHLISETSNIDIHIVRQERKDSTHWLDIKLPVLKTGFFPYWVTFWFLLAVTFLSYSALDWIGYRAVGFVFLGAVLVVGGITSPGPILFAAIFTAIVWNYFFIPPQFTLSIKEPEDFMNVLALFFVALVAGYLASRNKKQESDLVERAHRTSVLYEFSRRISEAKSLFELTMDTRDSIARTFKSTSVVLMRGNGGMLINRTTEKSVTSIDAKDFAVAVWAMQNKKRAGRGTDTLSSSRCLAIPLEGRSGIIGVLVLWPSEEAPFTLEQENMLETFANHLAIGIERELFETKAKDKEILENSERLHQALLSSVSHELRTPLTSILGNITALNELIDKKNPVHRQLVEDIVGSSERLNRVVENLLDMSRISSGALKVKAELFEISDFVHSTIKRSQNITQHHRIIVDIKKEPVYFRGDEQLLEHVLVNLLANACAYSPENSTVSVCVDVDGAHVIISVTDEGPGIPEAELSKIFERFYRIPGTPAGGTGLGLPIAKSFVEAQGGIISARNREGHKGSQFVLTLPQTNLDNESLGAHK